MIWPPDCLTPKYVDNTALTEILTSATSDSHMPCYLQMLTFQTQKNDSVINTTKTKELVIGPWGQQNSSSLLSTQAGAIERITDFKLFGGYIDSKLSWKSTLIMSPLNLLNEYIFSKSSNAQACLVITCYIITLQ